MPIHRQGLRTGPSVLRSRWDCQGSAPPTGPFSDQIHTFFRPPQPLLSTLINVPNQFKKSWRRLHPLPLRDLLLRDRANTMARTTSRETRPARPVPRLPPSTLRLLVTLPTHAAPSPTRRIATPFPISLSPRLRATLAFWRLRLVEALYRVPLTLVGRCPWWQQEMR